MKIYLARPISGCTPIEVLSYYREVSEELLQCGYDVLCPMKGKANLRVEKEYRAEFSKKGYGTPIITNNSIFNRDKWMISQSDIVYVNLVGAKTVSIGSMMELAWASHFCKYVVLSMEDENVHQHAFVLMAAHTIFTCHSDAVEYLKLFSRSGLEAE